MNVVSIENDALDLTNALDAVSDNLTKELRIVSWKVARKVKATIAKSVTKELAVKQKVIKSKLKQERHGETGAVVTLRKSSRISLKEFKPRQTRQGVSYKISKSKGRKTIPGAFMGPRPGVSATKLLGHVVKRVGKTRTPTTRLYGPSPWGVFVKNEMQLRADPIIKAELRKQMLERLRFKTLKKQGVI